MCCRKYNKYILHLYYCITLTLVLLLSILLLTTGAMREYNLYRIRVGLMCAVTITTICEIKKIHLIDFVWLQMGFYWFCDGIDCSKTTWHIYSHNGRFLFFFYVQSLNIFRFLYFFTPVMLVNRVLLDHAIKM